MADLMSSPHGQRRVRVAATDSLDFTDSVGRNFVASMAQQDKEMLDAAHRKMTPKVLMLMKVLGVASHWN